MPSLPIVLGQTGQAAGSWKIDPTVAWQKAQQANKPLLLFSLSPGSPLTEKMNSILQTDSAAATFIAGHFGARIDVNQLRGSTIAENYNIFKVPTMLIFTPDGKNAKRSTLGRDDTNWTSFAAKFANP